MENAADLPWDDLRVLLAVHRHKSLMAAGKSLGLSTSTTARRLEQLEQAVGHPLIVRTTTGTRLEPAALAFVDVAETFELGLKQARRHDSVYGGIVRISAPPSFALALLPALADVRRQAPELRLELVGEDRVVDIARGEADIAIRTVRTRSAVVVEKSIGRITFGLYASRDLVERRLRSTTITRADLARVDVVGLVEHGNPALQMRWLKAAGAVHVGCAVNTDALLVEATRLGQGIAMIADVIADDTDLVRLTLDDPIEKTLPSAPAWLVLHKEARRVPRIKLVATAVEQACKQRLPRS